MSQTNIVEQQALEQQEGSREEGETSKAWYVYWEFCFPSSVDYHRRKDFHRDKRGGYVNLP